MQKWTKTLKSQDSGRNADFNAEINADARGITWTSALKRALNLERILSEVRKINGSRARNLLIPTMKPAVPGDVEK